MFKVEKTTLNFNSSHIKMCHSLKRSAILKNSSIVLQKRLRSFHWSLFKISVMKRLSVLSQKPTLPILP